jgi:hypothetical protein
MGRADWRGELVRGPRVRRSLRLGVVGLWGLEAPKSFSRLVPVNMNEYRPPCWRGAAGFGLTAGLGENLIFVALAD